jgi:hypothetical protein
MITDYKKYMLVLIIGGIFIFSIIANIFQYCQEPKTKIVKTVETADTTLIKKQFEAELRLKLRAELKTIVKTKFVTQKINLDSLRAVTDSIWLAKIQSMNPDVPIPPDILGSYKYTAEGDTTLKDSTLPTGKDSLLTVNVEIQSRLPLDPNLKMKIKAAWYQQNIQHTVTNTVEIRESFWKRLSNSFNYSILIGGGQGIIHNQFDIWYGIGISINLKRIFGNDL